MPLEETSLQVCFLYQTTSESNTWKYSPNLTVQFHVFTWKCTLSLCIMTPAPSAEDCQVLGEWNNRTTRLFRFGVSTIFKKEQGDRILSLIGPVLLQATRKPVFCWSFLSFAHSIEREKSLRCLELDLSSNLYGWINTCMIFAQWLEHPSDS